MHLLWTKRVAKCVLTDCCRDAVWPLLVHRQDDGKGLHGKINPHRYSYGFEFGCNNDGPQRLHSLQVLATANR